MASHLGTKMDSPLHKAYEDGRNEFLQGLSKLIEDDASADFVIVCGERARKVHRAVLQIHSKVLAAACNGCFKEKTEKAIDLSHEDPSCVTSLYRYLYHLNYYARDLDDESSGSLGHHTKMCVLADQYDMPSLKALAVEKFKAEIQRPKFEMEKLSPEDACDLAIAATSAYDAMEPTTAIREEIIKVAITTKALSTNSKEHEQSDFEKVVRARRDIAVDIAATVMGQLPDKKSALAPDEHRYKCPKASCGITFAATMQPNQSYYCFRCVSAHSGEQWKRYRQQ